MAEPQIIQVTTTIDDEILARELSRSIVTARLAACAQVGGPITSTYLWQGAVEETREWTVVCKTTEARYEALAEHIRSRHPYDVPEILWAPVPGGDSAYLEWVAQEIAL
jgi:periplasmic divalent cation tolerance protein